MNMKLPAAFDPKNPLHAMLPQDPDNKKILSALQPENLRLNSLIVQGASFSVIEDAIRIGKGTIEHVKIGSASAGDRADIPEIIAMQTSMVLQLI